MSNENSSLEQEVISLRADLAEMQARATYAGLLAEITFAMLSKASPPDMTRAFLEQYAAGLRSAISDHPTEVPIAARVAGLFTEFAERYAVQKPKA